MCDKFDSKMWIPRVGKGNTIHGHAEGADAIGVKYITQQIPAQEPIRNARLKIINCHTRDLGDEYDFWLAHGPFDIYCSTLRLSHNEETDEIFLSVFYTIPEMKTGIVPEAGDEPDAD